MLLLFLVLTASTGGQDTALQNTLPKHGSGGRAGGRTHATETLSRVEQRLKHQMHEMERRLLWKMHERMRKLNVTSDIERLQNLFAFQHEDFELFKEREKEQQTSVKELREQVSRQQDRLTRQHHELGRMRKTIEQLTHTTRNLTHALQTLVVSSQSTPPASASLTSRPVGEQMTTMATSVDKQYPTGISSGLV